MKFSKGHKGLIKSLCFLILVNSILCETEEKPAIDRGRYVPELYGAYKGKYTPDDSGKYIHMHRPYDGGYGDRGIKYVHDSSGRIFSVKSNKAPGILPLSPKDHLRFMIDFNYDGTGIQIVEFDWLRDGDENYKFKFLNENKLWNGSGDGSYDGVNADKEEGRADFEGSGDNGSDVHIDGEYNGSKGYDYSYTDRKPDSNASTLQNAIREVLEYIEVNILPTL